MTLLCRAHTLRPPGCRWTGTVTQIIPPNYGIVDGNAFYVHDVVAGRVPALGDHVACDAIPNTDGGQYAWRLIRVKVEDMHPRAGGGGAGSAAGPQPGRQYGQA